MAKCCFDGQNDLPSPASDWPAAIAENQFYRPGMSCPPLAVFQKELCQWSLHPGGDDWLVLLQCYFGSATCR